MPRCNTIARVGITLRVMPTLVLAAMLGGRALAVWQAGDVITHSQERWGGDPLGNNPADLLQVRFNEVYAATFSVWKLES
jgi:hypothetical protein